MRYIEAKVTCAHCSKPITLLADPCCPPDWADALASMACCNKCGDFLEACDLCGSKIVNCCQTLLIVRQSRKAEPDREKQLAEALTWLTKKYCRSAATYYGVTNLWDQGLVDLLMEKPDKAGRALGMMDAHLRKQSREPRPTHPDP